MGTMTLSTIRNLVRGDLNELGTTMLTDTELNSIANDGYKDTSVKGLCYESKITKDNIAASERVISLVANNVIRVNYVEYKTGATEGGKGILCVMPQAVGFKLFNGYVPQGWFQWGPYLIIEPIPDAATYDLAVYATCYPAAVMSADGDLPTSIPVEFHECVYLFTLAFAALKLKRWADAAIAYNGYIMDVQRKRAEYIMKYPDSRLSHEIPDNVTMETQRG
jgi:hypothetical protein